MIGIIVVFFSGGLDVKEKDNDKIMIAEHILEVRHDASGTFLDVRGNVADFIRKEKFLPHWKIDTNVVNFRDQSEKIEKEGAFVGYKSAGYVVLNSQTRNFFTDRGSSFWRLIQKNKNYELPTLTRFGMRTKIFIPSNLSFEEINKRVYEQLFSEKGRSLVGGEEKDLQFTIELKESGFNVRIVIGPIHKDEAGKYFKFETDDFKKCGLFLDLDYYTTTDLNKDTIPKFLSKTVDLMWVKAECITSGLGL